VKPIAGGGIIVKEAVYENEACIRLACGGDQWQSLVDMTVNLFTG
jgi:hypothetical protein